MAPISCHCTGRLLIVGGHIGLATQSNQVFLQDCNYSPYEEISVPSFPVNTSAAVGAVVGDTFIMCGGFNINYQVRQRGYLGVLY